MSVDRAPAPAVPVRRGRVRAALTRSRRAGDTNLLVLLAVTTLAAIVALAVWPEHIPVAIVAVPLLIGHLALGPRELPWFVVATMMGLAVVSPLQPSLSLRVVLEVVVVFVLGFIILLSSFRRSRLGVAGARGESMLVDLRDRINRHGGLPDLPADWEAESALRSASGSPFAGDFVVASRPHHGDRFDVVLVDVSGKGDEAGTRSLLLSGAFGGLLGALRPEDFLPAANEFLIQQDWEEGFATAVHLSLNLKTGEARVWTAGHPPAVQLTAGSGRWSVHDTEGPLLGLIPNAEFTGTRSIVRPGDVILLYTDGMVETPTRDINLGIDRLVGQAERDLRGNFEKGADRLVDGLGSRNDDRALIMIHRR
ncbi:MAG: PP2C family protein-serine/threonine phosphatase [Nocardioides sp.]|uniref:PP2C family protein-serine/threonine phosphatase n=1 Tax=Nocardioides sp. TaxID=35761 RepID=UPI0039E63C95